MTGKELQKAVIDLAHLHGWRVAHFSSVLATGRDGVPRWRTPVVADGRGFPDLFMVCGDRAMAVEIKGDGDTLKDEQRQWLYDLEGAGIESFVFTPASWREGFVDTVLKRKQGVCEECGEPCPSHRPRCAKHFLGTVRA